MGSTSKHRLLVTSTPISVDAVLAEAWSCSTRLCIAVAKPPCLPLETTLLDESLLAESMSEKLGACWAAALRTGRVTREEPLAVLAAPCGKPVAEALSELLKAPYISVKCVDA